MHSVTKYLSGHSDVTMGALVFRENGGKDKSPLLEKITASSMRVAQFRLLLNAG